MECRLIDGNSIAADIRKELRQRVAEHKAATGITPTLVALMVGNNPASQIYVQKNCSL